MNRIVKALVFLAATALVAACDQSDERASMPSSSAATQPAAAVQPATPPVTAVDSATQFGAPPMVGAAPAAQPAPSTSAGTTMASSDTGDTGRGDMAAGSRGPRMDRN